MPQVQISVAENGSSPDLIGYFPRSSRRSFSRMTAYPISRSLLIARSCSSVIGIIQRWGSYPALILWLKAQPHLQASTATSSPATRKSGVGRPGAGCGSITIRMSSSGIGCVIRPAANLLGNPLAASYWRAIFNRAAEGFDTWDYSLSFSLWRREALSIVPSVNTVRNFGFGPDATHTTNRDARSDLKSSSLCFPLVHAPGVIRNEAFDKEYESEHCSGSTQELLKALRTSLRSRAASS